MALGDLVAVAERFCHDGGSRRRMIHLMKTAYFTGNPAYSNRSYSTLAGHAAQESGFLSPVVTLASGGAPAVTINGTVKADKRFGLPTSSLARHSPSLLAFG